MENLTQEQLSKLFSEIQDRELRELRKVNDALREMLSESLLQVATEKVAANLSDRAHEERARRDTEEGSGSKP